MLGGRGFSCSTNGFIIGHSEVSETWLPEGERRLAAIMFTDMVGYTALTQSDESLALEVLDRHNRLLRPLFPKFHGREVKAIGDSFLVEFDSALDAANCAVEIQRFLHDYNTSSRDEWKITLRIGIHLGDVVHRADDVFGDAVNIASRVQPMADPEGICLTDQVFGQVRNKISRPLAKVASQELKNVSFPVDIYKVVMPWEAGITEPAHQLDSKRIAVLPFVSLSPDPNDEYFADGLTEELIDRLCQMKSLEVIARTSVMNYKKKEKNASQIGRDLKTGALVEGSVRKAGNKIRVTAQLINANTEGHLWSSKYDRELEDIFAVQSDIAGQVAKALEIRLLPEERKAIQQKRTESTEAYTLYLKGRQLWNKRSKDAVNEAMECFVRASEIDPNFALAYVGIADCYSVMITWDYAPSSEIAPKQKQAALQALKLDENLAEAHTSYASALALSDWRWPEAEVEFKRAIELNPNYATAHQLYAYSVLRFARRVDEEMREVERALELDPLAPIMSLNKGQSLYLQERYDEAIECYKRVLQIEPAFFRAYVNEAGCLLATRRFEEATKLYEKYLPRLCVSENLQKLTLASAFSWSGRGEEAHRLLLQVMASSDESNSPSDFAFAYAGLGDVEKMFEFLELAANKRDIGLLFTLIDPLMKPFRSDPRFQELVRRAGIFG
jgi:TolB-like protein/Flp pilus assembly protein TadD